jgi:hypothetical protein
MSLMKPSPGDLSDRLCILELKLQDARDRGIPADHFEEERDQVIRCLATLPQGSNVAALQIQLALVHAHLWDLTEDQLAANAETVVDLKRNSEILLSLRAANAARYRIRRQIDEAYNLYAGAEKL